MLLSSLSQRVTLLAMCAALAAATACATQTRIVATNPAMSLAPTCTDAVAVYPDSDKIGVWPGNSEDNVMLRRADGAVDYWDGER